MLNEEYVCFVHAFVRDQCFKQLMRALRRRSLRNEPEPQCDAMNVRVHRHHRPVEAEEQHARSGLRANAVQQGEPVTRVTFGHVSKKRQVKPAGTLLHFAQCLLDSGGLHVRQSTSSDRVSDQFGSSVDDQFPRWKVGAQ